MGKQTHQRDKHGESKLFEDVSVSLAKSGRCLRQDVRVPHIRAGVQLYQGGGHKRTKDVADSGLCHGQGCISIGLSGHNRVECNSVVGVSLVMGLCINIESLQGKCAYAVGRQPMMTIPTSSAGSINW